MLLHSVRRIISLNIRVSSLVVSLTILLISIAAGAADEQGFSLRSHNPFLQVYGLPPFQSATLVSDGEIDYGIALDIANHADSGDSSDEFVIIDGESYFLSLSLRYGVTQRLEIGFDLPMVAHSKGLFDRPIVRWHKILGISNRRRSGPDNQLRFFYDHPPDAPYELTSSGYGLGDIQLTAAVPLRQAREFNHRTLTLRSSVKLPTGDDATLRGSGAMDLSFGLYGGDVVTFEDRISVSRASLACC